MILLRRCLWGLVIAVVLSVAGMGFALWHSGYRVYVVHTGSMMPTYNPGDVVIDRPAGPRVTPGEVITFRHSLSATDVVTHRVVSVTPSGIHTKGDANATADAWRIAPFQVRGQVIRGIPRLGYLLVYLRQPSGIGSIASAAVSVALLWKLFLGTEEEGSTTCRRHSAAHSAAPAVA